MRIGLAFNLLVCMSVLAGGCTAGRVAEGADKVFLPQIGAARPGDSTENDGYEQIVARLIQHLEDGALVLASVDDVHSSKYAAGMFIEAEERVVDLRRQMLIENPRDVTPPSVLVAYGPRYFFARFETEQQIKRIKDLGPDVHQPLKTVLDRIDARLKQVEKELKQAEDREASDG